MSLFTALATQQSIAQRTKALFASIKSVKVGELGIEWHAATAEKWREAGEELGKALSDGSDDWLVCIDELPVFIINLLQQGDEGRRRARAFLYWLRDLRQTHYRRVKWLLAGSIGLDTLAARLGLSDTINDLEPFPLDAFSEDSALRFLAELARSYGIALDEELRAAIVRRVGWPVPYYLQLMFEHLREECLEQGREPDAAMVEQVFATTGGNAWTRNLASRKPGSLFSCCRKSANRRPASRAPTWPRCSASVSVKSTNATRCSITCSKCWSATAT